LQASFWFFYILLFFVPIYKRGIKKLEIYHITGPLGSGKTTYLALRAREPLDKRGSGQGAIVPFPLASAHETADGWVYQDRHGARIYTERFYEQNEFNEKSLG